MFFLPRVTYLVALAFFIAAPARAQGHGFSPNAVIARGPARHDPVCARGLRLFLSSQRSAPTETALLSRFQLKMQNSKSARETAAKAFLNLSTYSVSAELGEPSGDLWRIIPHANGKTSIIVGDVSGHGLDAAKHTVGVHKFLSSSKFDALASKGGPAEALIFMGNNPPLEGANLSLMHLVYDSATGDLEYVSAGMPPLIIRRKTGEFEVVDHSSLSILGFSGVKDYGPEDFVNRKLHLNPGDAVIALSDGLYEGQLKGSQETFDVLLKRALRDPKILEKEFPELRTASPEEITRILRDRVESMKVVDSRSSVTRTRSDDRTAVVIQRQ